MSKKLAEWFGVKNKHQAGQAKRRISILYAVIGWNTLGVVFYHLLKDKIPEDKTERSMYVFLMFGFDFYKKKRNLKNDGLFFTGKVYSKLTGTSKNMHVYQVSGLTIKKEFELIHEQMAQEKKEVEENEQTTVTT
jgi:hypothetical protein